MTSTALTVTTAPALSESPGGLIHSKLKVDLGRLELTSSAIVFYKRSKFFLLFGLLGALLSRKSAGKRALDLPLASITTLARGKHGFNKKILDLTTADGKTTRFMLDRFDDFTARLRDELARTAKLESTGPEQWTVRR